VKGILEFDELLIQICIDLSSANSSEVFLIWFQVTSQAKNICYVSSGLLCWSRLMQERKICFPRFAIHLINTNHIQLETPETHNASECITRLILGSKQQQMICGVQHTANNLHAKHLGKTCLQRCFAFLLSLPLIVRRNVQQSERNNFKDFLLLFLWWSHVAPQLVEIVLKTHKQT